MYKLKFLFALAFITVSSVVFSQKFELNWQPEQKIKKKDRIGSVIGSDKNGYYMTKYSQSGFLFATYTTHIVRLNKQHEEEFRFDVPSKLHNKDLSLEGIYYINEQLFIFSSYDDKKADLKKLFVFPVSKSGVIGEEKQIDEINYKDRKTKGTFIIKVLNESKKILVIHEEGYTKKGNEDAKFLLYDFDFNLIWEEKIELPYKDKEFVIDGYLVDEENNVYIIGSREVKKLSQKKLIAYYVKSKKLEEANINLKRVHKVSDLNYNLVNGLIQFTGFYFNEKGGIQGIVRESIDPKTLKSVSAKATPFDKKDILKFATKRAAKKDKGIAFNYDIRQIIYEENGDILLVAEGYQLIVTTSHDARTGATRTTYTYYYWDIMVVRMDKEGEILWLQKVPKKQISMNDNGYYSSYLFVQDQNNFYFIYNTHFKNFSPKLKEDEKGEQVYAPSLKKGVIALTTLSKKDGKFESEIFKSASKDAKAKTIFAPKQSAWLNENEILVYGAFTRNFRLGIITVK